MSATADNSFDLFVDGVRRLSGTNWGATYSVDVNLAAGTHVIAIAGANTGTADGPASVLFSMRSRQDGSVLMNSGSAGWKALGYPIASLNYDNTAAANAAASGSGAYGSATYTDGASVASVGALSRDLDRSAQFDGRGDYVDAPDGFANFTSGMTLEAWVKPTAATSWGRVFDFGNGPDADNLLLARYSTTNDGVLSVKRGAADTTLSAPGLFAVDGAWHHIVATVTAAGVATVYKDGSSVATVAGFNVPLNVSRTNNYVGRSNWTGDPTFEGFIDEPAVYDKALTAARVTAHYQAGSAPLQTTASTYYADAEVPAAISGCTGTNVNQAGMLKMTTAVDPDGSGGDAALVREYRYDSAGRVKASRIGAGSWSCSTFDSRGRPLSMTTPVADDQTATRTTTWTYEIATNPRVSEVGDGTGTQRIQTEVDLLGRVITYRDAWGQTTVTTYDQVGRVTATAGPAGDLRTTFDVDGRVQSQQQVVAGITTTLATPSYVTATGELASATYNNGASLNVTRDAYFRTKKLAWAFPAAQSATDEVGRSQSGRVIDEAVDGAIGGAGDANPAGANFVYDGAGRLTSAIIPSQTLAYSYASSSPTCPTAGAAGPEQQQDLDHTERSDRELLL
jgi:YD repeat-containing protein